MPVGVDFFDIYSNDGSTLLEEITTDVDLIVTDATITTDTGTVLWTYSGDKVFLGLALTANATEPTYNIGDTIYNTQSTITTDLYIVEAEPEEEEPEEETTTPTAESVKSKLQSLLTASNAKTGKSDANLTDAVKTLLEGYGQGGGETIDEYDGTITVV